MKQLIATLPYPPSINRTWRQGKGRVYLAKNVIEYRTLVSALLCRSERFGKSHVRLDVKIYPPDNRRRDIDNPIKQILDSLQYAHVVDDDSQIKKLSIAMCEKIAGGRVDILVEEIV